MASILLATLPPVSPASMSASRRVPLGTLPNAANSNVHVTTVPQTKRPRSQSISQQREVNYVEKPVVKKQIIEAPPPQPIPRTPVRNRVDSKTMPPRRGANRVRTGGETNTGDGISGEGGGRNIYAPTTNVNNTVQNAQDPVAVAEGIERIRAWQAHFRRMFPTFMFYFEGLPEESATKYHRQVQALGATVAKFFSNTVTHVITTKSIPPETTDHKQISQTQPSRSSTATSSQHPQSRTTNRNSLHDKGTFNGQTHSKAEFTFKAPQGSTTKKFASLTRQQDSHGRMISYEDSRTQQNYSQILLKARGLGIKIWALEKLQRMLNAMADGEPQQQVQHRGDHDVGNKAVTAQDDHLSRLLRNERIHGPSDRDPDALSKDMVYFTGPFIMVKDQKATHKPIMVREYEKVAKREDGLWPQFRSTASGKCPFIDDQATVKEREREKEAKELKEQEKLKELKRAQAMEETAVKQRLLGRMQPPAPRASRQIEGAEGSTALARKPLRKLESLDPQDNRPDYGRCAAPAALWTQPSGSSRLFNVPAVVPAKRISNEMAFTSTNTAGGKNTAYHNSKYAYEPAASGVQPSNITSAIRSQMVSSHIDAPGAKAGMSRDMLELKRKATGNVVEIGKRSAIAAGVPRFAQTLRGKNLAAPEKQKPEPEPRTALRKELHEKIGKAVPIFQDVVEEPTVQARRGRQATAVEAKKAARAPEPVKEPKPGYCENCREKFDHFDEHTMSRRHRKFACNENNFADLDQLLEQLERPLRQRYTSSRGGTVNYH
ncbi:Dfp1/Him1, central region-domain-containing protein [Terfezia claveryi]|nr:Dfp1/Him1, central region-domain-containing protein [Terfezia claveryi]